MLEDEQQRKQNRGELILGEGFDGLKIPSGSDGEVASDPSPGAPVWGRSILGISCASILEELRSENRLLGEKGPLLRQVEAFPRALRAAEKASRQVKASKGTLQMNGHPTASPVARGVAPLLQVRSTICALAPPLGRSCSLRSARHLYHTSARSPTRAQRS